MLLSKLKFIVPLILLAAARAKAEDVSQCFAVRSMVKTEDARYMVDAVSRCAREYDAVYVMLSFFDHAGRHLDNGVWAIYWCRPGRREVHEFQIPPGASGFSHVVTRRITTDSTIALRR